MSSIRNLSVAEDCRHMQPLIEQIESIFEKNGHSIFKKRNEIKVIDAYDEKLAVKSFRPPSKIQRVFYSFFRQSKAQRSYKNASKILAAGMLTPEPVAFVEINRGGLLYSSFYISKYWSGAFTFRDPLRDGSFPKRIAILTEYGRFIASMHHHGINHKDLSAGNVLIKQDNDDFLFAFVDVNRMSFGLLNRSSRMRNMAQNWLNPDDWLPIVRGYSEVSGEDFETLLAVALKEDKKYKTYKRRIWRVKNFLRSF